MEILSKLGIDLRILVAQLVNFALVLFVLHRFAYKPLLALLEKREKTIEQSMQHAKEIEKKLNDTTEREASVLAKARREAAALIEEAAKVAEQKRATTLEKAKDDVAAVIADAKAKIAAEKATMLSEAKSEFADLVTRATRAVIEIGVAKEVPEELVTKVAAKVNETARERS